MDKDLEELNNLANTAFQNVQNVTPSIRHFVANAKMYQKSVQATCNLAVMFVESFQQIAKAASASEGSTKKLGDVLIDIMDAFKEIENMKLELTKLFINEIIIPLESKAENEINLTKSTHKSYNHENKIQAELTEKAIANASKYRKKSLKKKKPSHKLEEKEQTSNQLMEEEIAKLKKVREEGLRKALIDERRIYCFVAERMCSYGRGIVVYNNRISNFINQKLPDWQQFIAKPTELPQESEDIVLHPTGYKMGTVKGKLSKSERRESIKRGKSFNNHFPTKYSTMEGRASRGGSRPTLSNVSMASSNVSLTNNSTPTSRTPTPRSPLVTTPDSMGGHVSPSPPKSINGDLSVTVNGDINDQCDSPPPVGLYVMPLDASPSSPASEYANVIITPSNEEELAARSFSFSGGPIKKPARAHMQLTRTESDSTEMTKNIDPPEVSKPDCDFASKLAAIQSQLSAKMNKEDAEEENKQFVKALYKHEAQDASQLSFDQDDIIIPVCEPTSGWQYGENEKTKKSGWFPAAFTEEVIITNTGDSKSTSHGRSVRRPPPVMAKKAALRHRGNRKISVAVTQLVHPSKTSTQPLVRRGSFGDMPTSSSVPEMIHSLGEGKKHGHQRKHSNSLNGLEINTPYYHDDGINHHNNGLHHHNDGDDSFDESNEDLSTHGKRRIHHQDYDAMPPPPPPPPISDDDDEPPHMQNDGDPFDGITMKQTVTSS